MSEHEAMIILNGVVLGYQCVVMPGKEDRDLIYEALKVYNAALKEREEQGKGCEHCNNKELPLEGGAHDFRILGNAIFYYDATFGWEGTTIERCPWCGRPLEEQRND